MNDCTQIWTVFTSKHAQWETPIKVIPGHLCGDHITAEKSSVAQVWASHVNTATLKWSCNHNIFLNIQFNRYNWISIQAKTAGDVLVVPGIYSRNSIETLSQHRLLIPICIMKKTPIPPDYTDSSCSVVFWFGNFQYHLFLSWLAQN